MTTSNTNPFPEHQVASRVISQTTWSKIHNIPSVVGSANDAAGRATTQLQNANTIGETQPALGDAFQGLTGEASMDASIRQMNLTEDQAGEWLRKGTLLSMISTSASGADTGLRALLTEYDAGLAALKAKGDAEGWTQEEFRKAEEELVNTLKTKGEAIAGEHETNANALSTALSDKNADPAAMTGNLGSGDAAANVPSGLDSTLQGIMGQLTGQASGAQQQASGLVSKGLDTGTQLAQMLAQQGGGEPITPEALEMLTENQAPPGGDAPLSDEPPVGDEPTGPPAEQPSSSDPTIAPVSNVIGEAPASNTDNPPAATLVDGGPAQVTAPGSQAPASEAPSSAPAPSTPTATAPSTPVQTTLSNDPGPSSQAPSSAPSPTVTGGGSEYTPSMQAPTETPSMQAPTQSPMGTDLSSANGGTTLSAAPSTLSPSTMAPSMGATGMPPAAAGFGGQGFGAPMGPVGGVPAAAPMGFTSPAGLTTPMGPPPVTAPPAAAPAAAPAPSPVSNLSAGNPGAAPAVPAGQHAAAAAPATTAGLGAQNNQTAASAGGFGGAPMVAPVAVGAPGSAVPSGGYHVSEDTLNDVERSAVDTMRAIKHGLRQAGLTSSLAIGVYPDGQVIFTTIDGLGYLPDGMSLPAGVTPLIEHVSDEFLTDHTGCDRPSFVLRKAADLALIPMPNIILATDRNTSDPMVTTLAPTVLGNGPMPSTPVTRADFGGIEPSDVEPVTRMLTGYWGETYPDVDAGASALTGVRWQAAMNTNAAAVIARYMLTDARTAMDTGRVADACYSLQRALWIATA